MDKLAIVIPVYNEQDAIGGVLEKWVSMLDGIDADYSIFAYNDGSKDRSLSILREYAAKYPGKVQAMDKPNGGHGHTILTGYRKAAIEGYDWVFQIDSDDEMGPEKFSELWAKRHDFDFLVGYRDGRKQALPRKLISFVSRCVVRLFYGDTIWDVNTPYRLMRVSYFNPIYTAIPERTFAPNVIISGMASGECCRRFEMPVPQHDRTTGEVSIKKWKLLKAAAKSFGQTILFALRPGVSMRSTIPLMGNKTFRISSFASWVLCVLAIALIPWASSPSIDEIGTADTAVNLAVNGSWVSYCWQYSYNLLHLFLLTGWLKIFGVSHLTVCALNVVTAGVAAQCLLCILRRRRLLAGLASTLLFVCLFWGGTMLAFDMMLGRLDMLALLFTVLVVDEICRPEARSLSLLVKSFLCMASAVYPIPIIVFLGLFVFLFSVDRFLVFKKGIVFAAGVLLAFVAACVIYAFEGQVIRFVHTYFSFNATLSGVQQSLGERVLAAYGMSDRFLLVLGTGVLLTVLFRPRGLKSLWKWIFFVALVPALMAVSGRCAPYYMWLAYVPSVVILCALVSGLRNRIVGFLLMLIVGFALISTLFSKTLEQAKLSAQMDRFERFVSANSAKFIDVQNVVLADDVFYYAVQGAGRFVWRLSDRDEKSPREKFLHALNSAHLDSSRQKAALLFFDHVQKQQPKFPEQNAAFVCYRNAEGIRLQNYLKTRNYSVILLAQDTDFSIFALEKITK